MPLAETSARKAVELLESESKGITLDSVSERAFRRANLLVASWDTLGWVYFNEGKATLAEDYVRAAWRNASNAEEGLHMGEILEKKGENKAALETYEMAAGQSGGANSKTPVATALRAHIEELKKKGVAAQEERPDRLLQDQRTFHLPRPSGTKGSGVFALQVSAAGTEKVAMLRGDQSLRPLDEALKKLDLRLGVPKDSHASLLRSGILFCSSEPTCDFVLVPPEVASTK